jgi:hypothetical protein
MKKILQALDNASTKPVVDSNDMKKFVSIVREGKGPLNRPTVAETLTMQHYTTPKKTITAPVLNVAEGATPSMIGKYFKTVEQELKEAAERPNERATKLAKRIIERIVPNADGSLPDPSINRLTGKPNTPAAEPAPEPAPSNVKPGGATVEYGGETYSVNVFGDGIRPRIGPGNKVVAAKAYIIGNKIYVLLDPSTQEGIAEDKDPCWDSHKMVGTKKKGGKTVPNCVPKESVKEDTKRCMQCGMTNCSCAPGKCKCKPVAGWIPNKGFKKAVDEAANLAKQAAIAIAKKKAGKK